jgi:hypothetical protein
MKSPHGSSVANRALELIGTELGMFRSDGPPKPLNPEDLSIEQIRELHRDGRAAAGSIASTAPQERIP